ncbi:MAG: hypothetical protein KF819_38760, partial [Labilithrix sp.]|nr:hypothetical protein [Labilithrix sp.]
ALVSSRGLGAAEYLLFYDGVDNACPPTSAINAAGQWAALGAPEIAKRKAAYARAVAADGVTRAQAIVDAWDPAKENFLAELADAGKRRIYSSQQMAFNALSDSMFYVDSDLKDDKVGKPAGLVMPTCDAPPCLDLVESQWAKRSKEHMRNNLVGFEKLLAGCGGANEGLGFDDLLRAVGAEQTVKNLEGALAGARAALDALKEPTFDDDLTKNPEGVKQLFLALRALAAVMKTELLSVLDLELPKEIQGDND